MAVKTIVINNFAGRLTRVDDGDLNSGFAKFNTSFGYDPFTQPGKLTWLPQPTSITGIGNTNVVVSGITQPADITSSDPRLYTYVVDVARKLYKIGRIGPFIDSVMGQQSVQGTSQSMQWGAGMAFFGLPLKFYILGQGVAPQVVASLSGYADFTLNGATSIIGNQSFMAGNFHPVAKFAGKLIFGNGPSFGAIDNTNTIISSVFTISGHWGNQYSQLFPALDSNMNVADLDVSQDGNYLQISASELLNPRKAALFLDRYLGQPVPGAVYGWNGVDQAVTTALNVPFGGAAALENYLQKYILFTNDGQGMSVSDGQQKIVTVSNNMAPFPQATDVNGNFAVWMTTENVPVSYNNSDPSSYRRYGSLYYFGALDQENPVGLFRMLRMESPLVTAGGSGQVYNIPYHEVVANTYFTMENSRSSVIAFSLIKHYFSLFNASPTIGSPSTVGSGGLFSFIATSQAFAQQNIQAEAEQGPPMIPQEGVYETQTQMFPKKVSINQIRFYVSNVHTNSGFSLEILAPNGFQVGDAGGPNFEWDATNDPYTGDLFTTARINYNPKIEPIQGFSLRITNTGSENMIFEKIEVDLEEMGR